jgi:hypothetical protein
MNTWYGARHTERKARLLMLAACQRHPAQLRHESVRQMVELLVAHYADPRSLHEPFTGYALAAPYRHLQSYASSLSDNPERGVAFGMVAAAEPVSTMKKLKEDFPYLVYSCLHDVAAGVSRGSTKRESKLQAALLRELLGNPFRPVAGEPEWLTATVVALARQIHESQEFRMMPVLADALQEAGCEQEDILKHCRDEEQVHVRGCWLLDLILEAAIEHDPTSKPADKRKPRARKAKS